MHQKLFGSRAPPGPAGELKVPQAPRCIYGRAGQWESDGGKDKGGDERVGRGQKGGEREGNERKERGVVLHPKLNPGCATRPL